MIVSWNWLKQYVPLDMPVAELERRLMMAGLNHEGTSQLDGDLAIDFEVTSNRPDCLGHLGIAREAAVLFDRPLTIPPAEVPEGTTRSEELVKVRIDCPDLCYRYTARVVRGVKVAASPDWMARRLQAVGLVPVNNVVDISNYVLMECGQPLHTFDYGRLKGPEIIVRRPRPNESIEAIDHKTYALGLEMCIIADAKDAVAIGGVMGGASTEINSRTRDVLVEAAEFDPVSIRNTARQLNLHSDSSYRFERKIDPEGVEWASRRCCELILELCGGELAAGVLDVGRQPEARQPVVLRYSQLKRILGIEIDRQRVRQILVALGNRETAADASQVTVVPPSWRRDLTREIDLVEEVARIHGYDQIPEDVLVPMAPSIRSREDRVVGRVRQVLTALGFDEAMTLSVVEEPLSAAFSPWTQEPPLQSQAPVLRGADRLRRSVIPSLLAARRTNESLSNPQIELFEIAKVYLPQPGQLPLEDKVIALSSSRDFEVVKGVVESLLESVHATARLDAAAAECGLLDPEQCCRLLLDGKLFGFLGRVPGDALRQFELRGGTVVAELRLAALVDAANLVPRYEPLPAYPAVTRDLNFVVSESVRWADVAATVQAAAGQYFESLQYVQTYRDPRRIGEDKKSLLMTLGLRWKQGTLTSQEADRVRDEIVAACQRQHAAQLRA